MAIGDIAGLLDPLIESAQAMHTVFIPLARTMLALAFTLAVAFAVYQWWLGEAGAALSRLVRAGLIMTIPLTLLVGDNWRQTMDTATQFFSAEMTQPILGTTGAKSGTDAIAATITELSLAMFPNARKPDERSALDKIREFINSDESIGSMVFSGLTQAVIELVLFLLALVMSVALIFALYGPLVALHIGVIFGPLLLAWMPFGPMSHLARNWLTFMISQGFALVVGIAIAMLAVGSIASFTDSMTAMANDATLPLAQEIAAKLGGFMASAAVIVFVAFMLFRADDIAAAMIGGGGAGAGGVGAVVMSRIASAKMPKPKPEPPKPPK